MLSSEVSSFLKTPSLAIIDQQQASTPIYSTKQRPNAYREWCDGPSINFLFRELMLPISAIGLQLIIFDVGDWIFEAFLLLFWMF